MDGWSFSTQFHSAATKKQRTDFHCFCRNKYIKIRWWRRSPSSSNHFNIFVCLLFCLVYCTGQQEGKRRRDEIDREHILTRIHLLFAHSFILSTHFLKHRRSSARWNFLLSHLELWLRSPCWAGPTPTVGTIPSRLWLQKLNIVAILCHVVVVWNRCSGDHALNVETHSFAIRKREKN